MQRVSHRSDRSRCKHHHSRGTGTPNPTDRRFVFRASRSIFPPDAAFDDARRYLPILLAKRKRPEAESLAALEYLRTRIEEVDPEIYAEFEEEARQRLRGRDEDDWPILAAALALRCPVWTEDADFFGTGVAVWTTSRIEIDLKARAASRALPSDE
jgi:hypothetical protein